jgi:hypothetical protein
MIDWEKDSGTLAEKYKGVRHKLSQEVEETQGKIEGEVFV